MAKKTKSMRGADVDFDLMDIKKQISSAPQSIDVKNRETFIDDKMRRRLKKAQNRIAQAKQGADAAAMQATTTQDIIDDPKNTHDVVPPVIDLAEEVVNETIEEHTDEVIINDAEEVDAPIKKKRKVRK